MSDEEIKHEYEILQKARKNPKAFGELYEKYFDRIFNYVYRQTEDEDLTADLCSQTFLLALKNIDKYEFRGVPFSAWLYRIALNEVQGYYRNTKKERVVQFSEEALLLLRKDLHPTDNQDEEENNEPLLLRCLEQLNKEDMVWIELRFFENRSFREIAAIQQVTENNAKLKTYRILEKLRKFVLTRKD